MEREVFRGGCFFVGRLARVRRPSGPGPRRDRRGCGRVADGARGGHPGRPGGRPRLARGSTRAARVRDALAWHGRELGVPALPGRRCVRARARIRDLPAGRRRHARRRRSCPLEIEVDDGAARRTLRDQIAKLERELADALPRRPARATSSTGGSGRPAGPACSTSVTSRRFATTSPGASRRSGSRCASGPSSDAGEPRSASRRWSRIPPSHKWQRLSNDDIGEPGCKHYHSTPQARPRRDADGLVARQGLVRMPIAVRTPGSRRGT